MPEVTDQTILTAAGLNKLKAELEDLKNTRRPAIVARIKEAVSHGDLSENAEYDEAKNEQGFVEGRINELQAMLENPKIVKTNAGDHGKVALGSIVSVTHNGSASRFTIVGHAEADPDTGLISNESPLGQALLGAAVGEKVTVETPRGSTTYEVASIGQ